jgi:hypothetical protein
VSRADLPPSVLWRNRQTETHLVSRSKPRNHRSDFDAQITKAELSILRPKPKNPPPPWFWGSTNKPTTGFETKSGETVATSFETKLEKTVSAGFEDKPLETVATVFEAKLGETVATSFEAKLEKTVTTGFEAKPVKTVSAGFEDKPLETVTTGFEAKPVKTVRVVLRSNHSQTVAIGFKALIDEKSSEWFWGQTTHKSSTLILRLN